ncbi:MAG: DNA repair ATPase [Candidatus Thiodiazotropha sp. (ex Dulcina madagascariensis)]|nr:DNA repair ATPase [Candidatus Thiodiazotropha sp. (ex Dulcina madagascariensis)]
MSDTVMTDEKQNLERAVAEGGAYEVIRKRLLDQADLLGRQASSLNEARLAEFGDTAMEVIGRVRVHTENNCIARDIALVNDTLLFGYNVFIGLKKETRISDVFGLYRLIETDDGLEIEPLSMAGSFLDDPAFVADFKELYAYYKETRFSKLLIVNQTLLATFQIGNKISDVKVFRWAIGNDASVRYIDNRGERDIPAPPRYDFEWTACDRENFISGRFPHISILDEVFVDTINGSLTIKVENNTEAGLGIHDEPVDDDNQSLADATVEYAKVGRLILLKILPYREKQWRYFVFNSKTKAVLRIDAIGEACQQLPEDHGLIFPGGYYLESGENKAFDEDNRGMQFEREVKSPNGEDVLYRFYEPVSGRLAIYVYNLIRKELQTPLLGHGFARFDDGTALLFSTETDEPTRNHPMQVWRTPFASDNQITTGSAGKTLLGKIGNAELVRAISEFYTVIRHIREQQPSATLYEDLIKNCGEILDSYHWIDNEQTGSLGQIIRRIRETAELVLDEFEKVQTIQQQALHALADAEQAQEQTLKTINRRDYRQPDDYVVGLKAIQQHRGHLLTLREQRYIDHAALDRLDEKLLDAESRLSKKTVAFLQREDAFGSYETAIEETLKSIGKVEAVVDIQPIQQRLDEIGDGLDLLTEMLNSLKVDDTNIRTTILETMSTVYARLNQARAHVRNRLKEVGAGEAVAEFAAQFALFSQSVINALGLATTPEKCDEQLAKLLVHLEEFESKFSEFDEFLNDIIKKREEVYETFEARKQTLLDERQRRIHNLGSAASRLLDGIEKRTRKMQSQDEINTYFAADPMVNKVRSLSVTIRELGDTVRSDDIDSRLKSAKEQSVRSQRDKQELFEEGGEVIKFGRHRFSVNVQETDLTIVPHGDDLALHLSGSDYFEPLADQRLIELQGYWEQSLPSENTQVYRVEYLVYTLLNAAERGESGLSILALLEQAGDEQALAGIVRKFMTPRYQEGYEKGIHDQDGAKLLAAALQMYQAAGLLRFSPRSRALGMLFWHEKRRDSQRLKARAWIERAQSVHQLEQAFGASDAFQRLREELTEQISEFSTTSGLRFSPHEVAMSAEYLTLELAKPKLGFEISDHASELADRLMQQLRTLKHQAIFVQALDQMEGDMGARWNLVSTWIEGFIRFQRLERHDFFKAEATALLLIGDTLPVQKRNAVIQQQIEGLLGDHSRIEAQSMPLVLPEFLDRLYHFTVTILPEYESFRALRSELIAQSRKQLRVEDFQGRPLTSFVRNRLINEAYLPIIGDNLAKQLGTVGEEKRTDLMGLLLLISPPGYGKTTLMEYIANRMGLLFMKINCPSLGHDVLSLDPAQAPNATARQELKKLNLGLEMANNVMLYLDDIQHTNAEFLQKFISLSDGTRRIEGVWKEEPKTYDLRGKKFCIVMAGNPYTESGDLFKIPDMLANRADIYNLGDVLSGREEAFALSYIENSLTSNPVLAPLAIRDMQDVYRFIRLAKGENIPSTDFSHPYSGAEINEIVAVLQKLFTVQQTVMRINQQYIESAAQADKYRTEPPFKLQGSYRNMNKLAEKISSIMNEDELNAIIRDHYIGEAQTLTSGAEENLLKLGEISASLTEEEIERWNKIKADFARIQGMGGEDADSATKIANQIATVSGELNTIEQSLSQAFSNNSVDAVQQELQQLVSLIKTLELNIEVVNKPVPGMDKVLSAMGDAINVSLLPVVQAMEHKLKMDHDIWERVKRLAEQIDSLEKSMVKKTRTKRKLSKKSAAVPTE